MIDYSNFIVKAMEYVDKKIETLNPSSVDRNKIRSKTHTQIVANVKRIALLEQSDMCKEIDRIFNTQLLEEFSI